MANSGRCEMSKTHKSKNILIGEENGISTERMIPLLNLKGWITMKKIIAFVLALVMCLSLCACGKDSVASQLEGTWSNQSGEMGFTFSNIRGNGGDIESFFRIAGTSLGNSGTFTVEGSAIKAHYPHEDGKAVDTTIDLILENGEVTGVKLGDDVLTKD